MKFKDGESPPSLDLFNDHDMTVGWVWEVPCPQAPWSLSKLHWRAVAMMLFTMEEPAKSQIPAVS